MRPISNEVLAEQINNLDTKLGDFVVEVKDHIKNDGARLTTMESWKAMVTGALVIMNLIFVPIFIWIVIRLLEKRF